MIKVIYLTAVSFLISACDSGVRTGDFNKIPTSNAIISSDELSDFNAVIQKSIYIPVYSNILNYDKNVQISLQVLMSLRNTDSNHKIKITKVAYYDTNGRKVKDFLDKPVYLKALGSYEVVIKSSDLEGGSGAKFLVDWESDQPSIQIPLAEVVMTGFMNSTNISFSSRGVSLK